MLFTAVYVVATVVIVYYNRRSIGEMKATREAESRPYLFVYLLTVPRYSHFYLVICNYSKTGGTIENLNITPDLNFIKGCGNASFLNKTAIAPDQSIQIFISDQDRHIPNTEYEIRLEYADTCLGNKYSEKYQLNLQYACETGYACKKKSNCSEGDNALINIAAALDTIKMKLQ